MKYKQANGFPARILLSLPFWFSEVLWMRYQASLVKDWREKRCPLSFHIPAPLTCLWAEVAALSPNVAPPPAGKFEELQSSAVTPDTFEKGWNLGVWKKPGRKVMGWSPHVFLWQPDKPVEASFLGWKRGWEGNGVHFLSSGVLRSPDSGSLSLKGGTIASDEKFGSDWP